ncbi:MAG: nucleotidyltransferase family protein [Chloroflexi bacterium]|nr:nucleotidyltransferase family protein [Chloroflexota bacterium]
MTGTTPDQAMPGISAILLAAGESTRMGRLKALLSWQGSTLIEYQVQSLSEAGVGEIVVVVGHRGDEVRARVEEISGVIVAPNPDYWQGKTISIKTGLRHLTSTAEGVLVLAVDQPRPASILRALIKAHVQSGSPITCPVFHGRSGHPIIFTAALLPELMAITEQGEGLRAVSRRYREQTNRIEVGSPIVTLDVNSPQDVEQAVRLFQEIA